ncbi:MAG: glycosyltransferase [Candidatus Omnitrophica bacterium]|nr:glycosyltransferase [Candidatus Omnitrophota bacterium]
MKILHSCYQCPDAVTNFMALPNYVDAAIKKLGHELISFDDRRFLIPGRIRDNIPFLHHIDLTLINNKLLTHTRRHKPDLCLFTGGQRIFPGTVKKIKSQGIATVLWTTDVITSVQPIVSIARCCDYVVCAGTEAIEQLHNNGVKNVTWLPFACDTDIHKPVCFDTERKKNYTIDIVFVGSYYPNRADILEELTCFNLAIWGPGWKEATAHSPLQRFIKGGALNPCDWTRIYDSAKIILTIHYQDGKNPCYQASPKVYEALACRGFLISDCQRDVMTLFTSGEHLVCFHDKKELKELIHHYLAHADEREKIAQKGYAEVLNKHTYEHRINKMLSIIGK